MIIRTPYFRVLFIDYSPDFDTVIPDEFIPKPLELVPKASIFNWLLNYMTAELSQLELVLAFFHTDPQH